MFPLKIFNILILLFLIIGSDKIDLPFSKEKYTSKIEVLDEGGIVKLNDVEINVNFFGYEDVPNKKTLWKKVNEGNRVILSYVNNDDITFKQIWDFKNEFQPTLNIEINSSKNINLRHEVIITNTRANKDTKTLLNFDKLEKISNESLKSSTFRNKNGWISISDEKFIFAIKIHGEKFEINKDNIIIYKENSGTLAIVDGYEFHSSCNQYTILKNQQKFKNLDSNVDFGSSFFYRILFLSKIAKTAYIIAEKLRPKVKSSSILALIIMLLLAFLSLPFSVDSIKMQKKLIYMQPEIDAIDKLPNINFIKKQNLTKEIHERYGFNQFKHILGQLLLIIGLTVFQTIFSTVEYSNLIPESIAVNTAITAILCFTILFYNMILFKNNQAFLAALFSLSFIFYPKLPLIGFIFLYWFQILLFYFYKLKDNE